MTDEELLLGPLLPRGEITSLIGTPGEEMATLAAAIAVSCKLGIELIPGWVPEPGEVTVVDYVTNWVFFKSLLVEICNGAGVATPVIDLQFPVYLYGQEEPVERDPDVDAFWAAYTEVDAAAAVVAAKVAGRQLPPHLWIVYGSHAAAPSDGLMLRLYKALKAEGKTALVVGRPNRLHRGGLGA
jgi:hypothetical protein